MEKQSKTILEEIQGTADEIITQIKRLIREGNARRVIIKNKRRENIVSEPINDRSCRLYIFY
jgi:hypothetical protein